MNKYTSSAAFPIPAYSYAFQDCAGAFIMWAYWQAHGSWQMPLAQAAAQMSRLRGVSLQQCYLILRQGQGRFWRISDGLLRLQPPRYLKGVAFRRAGVAKRSQFYFPASALREGIGRIRALLMFPVASRTPTEGTPRAYSAHCLGRAIRTVSRYRGVLRGAGYITTAARFGPAQGPLEPGAFQCNGSWQRRLPDQVLLDYGKVCNISDPERPSKEGHPHTSQGEGRRKFRALRTKILQLKQIIQNLSSAQLLPRYRPALQKLLGASKWKYLEGSLLMASQDAQPLRLASEMLGQAAQRLGKYAGS